MITGKPNLGRHDQEILVNQDMKSRQSMVASHKINGTKSITCRNVIKSLCLLKVLPSTWIEMKGFFFNKLGQMSTWKHEPGVKIVVTLYFLFRIPCLNFNHVIVMKDFHNAFQTCLCQTNNIFYFMQFDLKYVCKKNVYHKVLKNENMLKKNFNSSYYYNLCLE
jgi:hypothetical protein